jgi:hypothetical protein
MSIQGGLMTVPFPAASIQERMWFAERLEPDVGLYNVPHAWRIRGRLDLAALRLALAKVIAAHEILRTRFVERDGRLYQQVEPPWTPDIETVSFRDDPSGLQHWLTEIGRRNFDLTTPRLLRFGLADLGASQVLFVGAHHLIWDAATLPLFLAELNSCYRASPSPVGAIPRLPR